MEISHGKNVQYNIALLNDHATQVQVGNLNKLTGEALAAACCKLFRYANISLAFVFFNKICGSSSSDETERDTSQDFELFKIDFFIFGGGLSGNGGGVSNEVGRDLEAPVSLLV